MVLETAQLLSTALPLSGCRAPYRPTHVNHPASKGARNRRGNYDWLARYFISLCQEYKARFNTEIFINNNKYIRAGLKDRPVNITPYKNMPVNQAYIKYLEDKWQQDIFKGRPLLVP